MLVLGTQQSLLHAISLRSVTLGQSKIEDVEDSLKELSATSVSDG